MRFWIRFEPFSAPVVFSEALLGETSPITQFLKAFYDGGIVGVIKSLVKGLAPATDPRDEVTLLSNTNTGGVQTLDASLAPEARTSTVGKFNAPDLTKLVSLSVKPLEKAEDAVTGGETLTVDTTAGDTTGVQDPTTEGGTVETVKTGPRSVDGRGPTVGAGRSDPARRVDNTVETVKTEKPKLNEKKVNPLADLKGDPVLPETTITDGSSAAPESGLTKAIKKFVGGFGKHQKDEGTGTGAAAADNGGGETGGGDAG